MVKSDLSRFELSEKYLKCMCFLVIFLYLMSLLVGILVPVYTDEVTTKIMLARFFAENGKIVTVFPQCGPTHIIETPILFYPAAWVYAFVYGNLQPIGIRLSGVVIAFLTLILAGFRLLRTSAVKQDLIYLFAAICSILSLGIMPFLSVISRSEQLLVLLIILYTIFPIVSNLKLQGTSRARVLIFLLTFCFITSIFFYTHPKAIFFFPLCLVSACYTFGFKRKFVVSAAMLFVLFCTAQNFLFAKATVDCKSAPQLSAMLASNSVDLNLLQTSKTQLFVEMAKNVVTAPHAIIHHVVFRSNYQSGWLPAEEAGEINVFSKILNVFIYILLTATIWLSLIMPIIPLIKNGRESKLNATYFVVFSLWVGLLGHLALYKIWNFYGAALIFPLSIWILVLVILNDYAHQINSIKAKLALGFVLILALLSAYVLFSTVVPNLIASNFSDKSALKGQPLSVSIFNFKAQKQKIRKLADACGLTGDNQTRLIVDDQTFFAFDHLHQPLHLVYLNQSGFGLDLAGEKLSSFLSNIQSPGIIAQCTYIPTIYQSDKIQEDNLCCVNFGLRGH